MYPYTCVMSLISNAALRSSPTDGKAAFCIFLKSEFCEENIEFWIACEDFKNQTSHEDLVSEANRIYEEFIKSEAPKEVKLGVLMRINPSYLHSEYLLFNTNAQDSRW